MTFQAENCFCYSSHFLEVVCLYFILTRVIILLPSWIYDGVEDFILIVFILEKKFTKEVNMLYKVERQFFLPVYIVYSYCNYCM